MNPDEIFLSRSDHLGADPKDVSLTAYLNEITDPPPEVRKTVAKARMAFAQGGKDASDPIKRTLPIYNVSVRVAGGRKTEHVVARTRLLVADLDHTGKKTNEIKAKLATSPSCILVFKSVTDGTRGIFLGDPDKSHEENQAALAVHVKEITGLDIDPRFISPVQGSFASFDKDAAGQGANAVCIPYPVNCTSTSPVAQPESVAVAPAPTTPGALGAVPEATGAVERWQGVTVADAVEMARQCERLPEHGDHEERTNYVGAFRAHFSPEDTVRIMVEGFGYGADKIEQDLKHPKTNLNLDMVAGRARKRGWVPSAAFKSRISPATVERADRLNVLAELDAQRIGIGPPPPVPVKVVSLVGVPVITQGNLSTSQSRLKGGKTTVVASGIVASLIKAENGGDDVDCLGFTAAAPGGRPVLWFDSEQTAFDCYTQLRRALRRVGEEQCPPWVRVYSLLGDGPEALRAKLRLAIEREVEAGHPPHLVVCDGFGDYVADPNDAAESNDFVTELQGLANRYGIAIHGVMHENPGGDAGSKQRGHLGSQLMRKGETCIAVEVEKDGETRVVYTVASRGAPVPKTQGARFKWSDEEAMFTRVYGPVVSPKVAELRQLAVDVLTAGPLPYGVLRTAVMQAEECVKTTAEKKIKAMRGAGVIVKDCAANIYSLSPE